MSFPGWTARLEGKVEGAGSMRLSGMWTSQGGKRKQDANRRKAVLEGVAKIGWDRKTDKEQAISKDNFLSTPACPLELLLHFLGMIPAVDAAELFHLQGQ